MVSEKGIAFSSVGAGAESQRLPPCMEATVTHNTGPVALLNWWGVTRNAGPVAMHQAAFGSEFRAAQ